MEDADFDPFCDMADNPLIPQYLETISQLDKNNPSEEYTMDESVELQNSQSTEHDEIPDSNSDTQSQSGDEGQDLTRRQRLELARDERLAVYEMLLQKSKNGKLLKRTTTEVSLAFNIPIRTVQRIWKRGKESEDHNISLHRVNNCGRKRIHVDRERVRDIPLRHRTTQRDIAAALKVSRRTVQSLVKSGVIKRHTNAIKPLLTEANRQQRISHCLSMIDPASTPIDQTFQRMFNVVHIDEKWFRMTKKNQTYYLLADEDEPVRKIKSSNFIPKIMFLAAVARPRYDDNGVCIFDGKLGIFPLVKEVFAARSSVNRLAGSLEIKPIERIDREVIRKFMINMVLPAIRNKWPKDSIRDLIIIQQDNAKTHIPSNDLEFRMAASSLGLNVSLQFQPPNSPDLNILDLGFFRAIQSLQQKICARSVIELVAAVDRSFHEFSDRKCNFVFLTLQSCMVEILKYLGSNTYKIPHMSKDCLERRGMLPITLSCDSLIIATARANLLP